MNALALPLMFFLTSLWPTPNWVKRDIEVTKWMAEYKTPKSNVLWLTPKPMKSDFIEYFWPDGLDYWDESVRGQYGMIVLEMDYVPENFDKWWMRYCYEAGVPGGRIILIYKGKLMQVIPR